MEQLNLILSLRQGAITATNLGIERFAWHRRPGTGKFFQGRTMRRPGKVFRQVLFAELRADQTNLAAENLFQQARTELQANTGKKTKTIVSADCINRVPFQAWVGYRREAEGGIYAGDKTRLSVWRFPAEIPHAWERAEG